MEKTYHVNIVPVVYNGLSDSLYWIVRVFVIDCPALCNRLSGVLQSVVWVFLLNCPDF